MMCDAVIFFVICVDEWEILAPTGGKCVNPCVVNDEVCSIKCEEGKVLFYFYLY
jgi:hypothetical protein